jgi:hypothetical protein
MRSIAHLGQLSYNYTWDFFLYGLLLSMSLIVHLFGAVGNKGSIVNIGYVSFQEKRSLKLQGITDDANNTRELLQEL